MTNTRQFSVRPLNKTDQYYGFSLRDGPLHVMANGTVFHNSGKSVMEQAIVGHVSRYSDRFMLCGVDCKRVEFNLLRGVKGVAGVALDVDSAANIISNFQQAMMARLVHKMSLRVE